MDEKGLTIFHRMLGRALFQFLAVFTASLTILNNGMHFGWSSPSLPKLLSNNSHIPMTTGEASWVASTIMFGIVIGSVLTAYLLDRCGRKTAILLASVPLFLSWMLIAFARSFHVLILGRLIAGIGDGLSYSSVAIYTGEIAEPRFRGLLGAGASACWILGMFIMNTVGSYLPITTSAIFASLIPVLVWLTFPWMPESPYYLIKKNNPKLAAKNLRILKGTKCIESDMLRLTVAVQDQYSNSNKCSEIFSEQRNRKGLLIMLAFRFLQQSTGTNAIIFYAQIILREGASTTIGSVTYFALFFVSNVVCSAIVDKTGRKPLLIISTIGTCVSLFVVGCYFYILNKTEMDISGYSIVLTLALLIHAAVYSLGLQGIASILIGELFATRIKSLAACICHVCFALTSTIVLQGFQFLREGFGIHVPIFIFSFVSALNCLFIIFCVPETKGKTLERIQEELTLKTKVYKNEYQI